MSVAGKFLIAVPRGQGVERLGHRERALGQRLRGIAQVEPQGGKHLIVSRSSGMQPAAGSAQACGEQILDGGLTILLLERNAPLALCVLLADGRQRRTYRLKIRRRQQFLFAKHFRMCNRGADVVGHQAIVQGMVFARRIIKHARIERSSLVPEASHDAKDQCCASCSAGLKAFKSATTSVPVPSLVKTSASKLSAAL